MNKKIYDLLQLYDNMLTSQGVHRSQCDNTAQSEDQRLFHARWMIDQIQTFAEKDNWSEGRINRWLGFVQAILWSSQMVGLLALHDQTRDLDGAPQAASVVDAPHH